MATDSNSSNSEQLVDHRRVHLFGKPYEGLKLGKQEPGISLARIFSFSYDGDYYKRQAP